MPVLRGRTALQCYFDLMHSFHHRFGHLYSDSDSLVQEVTIGMGPAGELRYPSFRSEKWEFPGIGMLTPAQTPWHKDLPSKALPVLFFMQLCLRLLQTCERFMPFPEEA